MDRYPIGRPIAELDTPSLCLDAEALQRNIDRMAIFMQDQPAKLRPHTKTHKCPTIAWLQLRAGAIGVTCAKLSEAEVMAQAGIRDILIANQIVGQRKIARLANLAAYADVMVAVDHPHNAQDLSAAALAAGTRLRALVEVNVGMGRCGVAPGQAALELAELVERLPSLCFAGLMGYEGHAVMIADPALRRQTAEHAMQQLVTTRDLLEQHGLRVSIVSAGGTGTYDTTACYPGITEIEAGSYATMDGRYASLGLAFECALTVLAQVISVSGADHAVIDAGLKTLTTEFGLPQVLEPAGWQVHHLSEEHGTLERSDGAPLHPGDRVRLVPSHGCTTINLHDAYCVTTSDTVSAVWPIAARGCVR
jgi:D-serine deaminase-like pyridoxal phosphate-dependent protein